MRWPVETDGPGRRASRANNTLVGYIDWGRAGGGYFVVNN